MTRLNAGPVGAVEYWHSELVPHNRTAVLGHGHCPVYATQKRGNAYTVGDLQQTSVGDPRVGEQDDAMNDLGREREKGNGARKAEDFGHLGDGLNAGLGLVWNRGFLPCNCSCVQCCLYWCFRWLMGLIQHYCVLTRWMLISCVQASSPSIHLLLHSGARCDAALRSMLAGDDQVYVRSFRRGAVKCPKTKLLRTRSHKTPYNRSTYHLLRHTCDSIDAPAVEHLSISRPPRACWLVTAP